MDLEQICAGLKSAASILALQNASQKNAALKSVIDSINKNRATILNANKIDVENARKNGTSEPLIDRLSLNDARLDSICQGVQIVIDREDPIGKVEGGWESPKGLQIKRVRVPLGVVCIIYERRPNVTVDAFCLAYKSGNAILLRGSSAALESNKAICAAIKEGLAACKDGVPAAIELLESQDHSDVDKILNARGLIDVVLPRGGKKLIQSVVQNARVPVIETGSGVCHLYVDDEGDLDMALNIAENAKIQRPGVCNAIEAILVNQNIMEKFLPALEERFAGRVTFHADPECIGALKSSAQKNGRPDCVVAATDQDYGNEFLDYECVVKSVKDVDDAIEYINAHNTKHSESIVTNNRARARAFQSKVDAACVYVNASTRFTDGFEFGFGAELGISTQKLHIRGPMGLEALTTVKYLIDGDGQIRG
jgi:glutamate-5-semialdehyde dehydrogenase